MTPKTYTPLPLAASVAELEENQRHLKNSGPRGGTVVLVDGRECVLIPISCHGRKTLIDKADYAIAGQYRWGVKVCRKNERFVYAARQIWENRVPKLVLLYRLLLGFPSKMIDHINHDTLDNRRCNLRLVTPAQNSYNKRQLRGRLFKGVHVAYRGLKRTRYSALFKDKFLGYFHSEIEAAKAYDKAAHENFGEHALLNFPTEYL